MAAKLHYSRRRRIWTTAHAGTTPRGNRALANATRRAKFPAERERMRATFVNIGFLAEGFCAQAIGAQEPWPTALKLAASVNLGNRVSRSAGLSGK